MLAAYRAFWADVVAAGKTADWQSPRLARHATGKVLARVRGQFRALDSQGFVALGTIKVSPRVVRLAGEKATVQDCVDTSRFRRYDPKNKRWLDQLGGQPDGQRSTLTLDGQGNWKVAESVVAGNAQEAERRPGPGSGGSAPYRERRVGGMEPGQAAAGRGRGRGPPGWRAGRLQRGRRQRWRHLPAQEVSQALPAGLGATERPHRHAGSACRRDWDWYWSYCTDGVQVWMGDLWVGATVPVIAPAVLAQTARRYLRSAAWHSGQS